MTQSNSFGASAFGTYRRTGLNGRETKEIPIQELVKGEEKILVLVPSGSPEDLNAYSIEFWRLQSAVKNTAIQQGQDPVSPDTPKYELMDPTFEEKYRQGGLVEQRIEASDIVLHYITHNTWAVTKHPTIKIEDGVRYYLKFNTVTLNELINDGPKNILVYVDTRVTSVVLCERLYIEFSRHLATTKSDGIKTQLLRGRPADWNVGKDIVLEALPNGFYVERGLNSAHVSHVITIEELTGNENKLPYFLY